MRLVALVLATCAISEIGYWVRDWVAERASVVLLDLLPYAWTLLVGILLALLAFYTPVGWVLVYGFAAAGGAAVIRRLMMFTP
jgi:hypothetical protein